MCAVWVVDTGCLIFQMFSLIFNSNKLRPAKRCNLGKMVIHVLLHSLGNSDALEIRLDIEHKNEIHWQVLP